jgi:heme exporter protein C
VSYLIVLLLFCCYQPLRFAIEEPDRQSRFAAVFALIGGAFIPVNFIAVRMAAAYTHPRVFQITGAQLPLSMGLTFLAALTAIALLHVTLCRFELASKALRIRLRALDRALADRPTARGVDRAAPDRPDTPNGVARPATPAPVRSM